MMIYLVRVNRWTLLFLSMAVGVALAQEPAVPPPTLPDTGKGWLDMLVKMSPYLFGIVAPFGNDFIKHMAPKTIGKLPTPVIMIISSVLSVLASATAALVSTNTMDGGGVTPEVATVQASSAAAIAQGVKQSMPTADAPIALVDLNTGKMIDKQT